MKALVFNRSIDTHRRLVADLKPPSEIKGIFSQNYRNFTLYRPLTTSENLFPTLFYIPGNAFVASETSYTESICSLIASHAKHQVIVLNHRLAPEYKAPIPFRDVKNIFKQLLSKRNDLKIDPTKMSICGYSSGGNLAALLTVEAVRSGIPIAHQILISPITDLSRSLKGFDKVENEDPVISEAFVSWFLRLYLPSGILPEDQQISPYWLSDEHLKGLPPTDIIIGEYDRFGADGLHYANRLRSQGNMVHLFEYKGKEAHHGLWWNSRSVIEAMAQRLKVCMNLEPIDNFYIRILRVHNIDSREKNIKRGQKKFAALCS